MPSRCVARTIVLLSLCFGRIAHGQANAPGALLTVPSFDVATIKSAKADELTGGIRVSRNRFFAANASVTDLVKYAYGVHASQIAGGSDSLMHDRFDIEATASTDEPLSDAFKQMVRGLLAERFHLSFHPEMKVLPVYLLAVDDAGAHLTPTAHPDYLVPTVGRSPGALEARNATAKDFAAFLQRFLTDRPVVDKTGLPGKFDIDLHWTPEDGPPSAANGRSVSEYPNLFTAIREQLGLKLQPAKVPEEIMVIDSLSHPTEN